MLALAVLSLVLHMRWNQTLLINGQETEGASLLELLSESGIPTLSLTLQGILHYTWPQRNYPSPSQNGNVMVIGKSSNNSVQDILSDVVPVLKVPRVRAMNAKRSWIIGVDGNLSLSRTLPLFDEGDRIILVGKTFYVDDDVCDEVPHHFCDARPKNSTQNVFEVWSLQSLGNGTSLFSKKGNWTEENNLRLDEGQLFDTWSRNLEGRVLKISALGSPPVLKPPSYRKKRWGGYMFKIINTLAATLNFTYVVKRAENGFYGIRQEDGSWSGMIGELTRKAVDIGVGDLSWSPDRSMVLDLTDTVFPETVTFIYKTPAFYSRTWILFEAFDIRMWISLSSTTILISLSLFLTIIVHRFKYRSLNDEVLLSAAGRSVSAFYRTFLGQGVIHIPRAISSRMVLGTWFLGSLVLSALYGGTLTSRLSLHKSPAPAESLRELLASHPDVKLAVRNNSLPHAYFQDSPFWKDVWLKNIRLNIIPGKIRMEDTLHLLQHAGSTAPSYAWIAERSMLEKRMHELSEDPNICDLYVAKEEIVGSNWILALVRDSPFLELFNEKISRMRRFGLMAKWRKDYWSSENGTCRPSDGRNPSEKTPISLTDTQAVFWLLILSWMVGILILLAERRCYRRELVRN